MTDKKSSCPCGTECGCNPCTCASSSSDTCPKNACCRGTHFWIWASVRIVIVVLMIVGAYAWGVWNGMEGDIRHARYDGRGEYRQNIRERGEKDVQMMMRTDTPSSGSQMNMMLRGSGDTLMQMSMHDMGKMLEGKTGATLNKAFLEAMIPHHQGAIDMARYLAGSDKPELVKLGSDIITAQTKEIDQMQKWMKEWGYTR